MTKDIKEISDGTIVTPKNFQVAGVHSGVKRKRNDLGMIYSEIPANAAAVYTTNVIQAAPLQVTRESIANEGKLQAIIVNSGNANACTGEQGEKDAYTMRQIVAEKQQIPLHYVAVASTGVIGLEMPMDKIIPAIDELQLEATKEQAAEFNEAILTTDVFEKTTCYEAIIDGKKVVMAGSAKGSGMIEPNMATMLAFITTDLKIDSSSLESALKEATNKTFNSITVDGDTSTNDTVITLANGAAGNESLTKTHPDWDVFMQLLTATCEDLAKMIARDGEGATKLIEVQVNGALNDQEAIQVGKSIVGSSLVKTAVFGNDANWGRIIAAVGYSGATVDAATIDLSVGPIKMLEKSEPLAFSEAEATDYLSQKTVKIIVDLNINNGTGKAWGCDLTYDYVRINASYRS